VAYRADIEIAVKGAQELKRLQDRIRNVSTTVDSFNSKIEQIGGGYIVRNINNLTSLLGQAAAEFNKVALGTADATAAARVYVQANDNLNAGLAERVALLKQVKEEERQLKLAQGSRRFGGPTIRETRGTVELGPGPASPVGALVGQKSPVEERIRRTITARKEEAALQEALLKLEIRSAATANERLQLERQLALVTAQNVRAKKVELAGPQFPMAGPMGLEGYGRGRKPIGGGKGGGFGKNIGGVVSNAAIGGAFPLLFGQSGAAAAGGAIGGVAGSVLGPAGGFAGSLVGTLIGEKVGRNDQIKQIGEDIGFSAEQTKLLGTAFQQAGREFDKFQASVSTIQGLSLSIEDQGKAIQLASTLTENYKGKIDKVTNAFAGALSTGKVTQGTLNQLTSQGIPIQQALADKYKVSRDEILAMAKDGKISTQDLIDTLVDLGNKGPSEITKNVTTFDKLKTSVENLGTAFVTLGTTIVNALSPVLDWLGKRIADIINIASDAINEVARLVEAASRGPQASARAALKRGELPFGVEGVGQIIGQERLTKITKQAGPGFAGIGVNQKKLVDLLLQQPEFKDLQPKKPPKLTTFETPSQAAPSSGSSEADKAAKAAEREAARVANIVRDQAALTEQKRLQAQYSQALFTAEVGKDEVLKIQLQREQKIGEISLQYSKQINDEKAKGNSAAVKEAFTKTALVDVQVVELETAQKLAELQIKTTESYTNIIDDLNYQLELKTAVTEQDRIQLQLAYETAKLKKDNPQFSQEQIDAITQKKTSLAAPKTDRQTIEGRVGQLQDEIKEMTKLSTIAITSADGIGNAFANSFKSLIDGSMSAREALSSFFKDVASMFLDMAAQIIAKQMTMIILQSILKALGAVAGAAGGATPTPGATPQMTPGAIVTPSGFSGQFAGMAAKGAYFSNGVAAFANGGIVGSPTMFRFANGGTTQTGLMGEAGPEAIMPLSRGAGGKLGVNASGLREAMGGAPGMGSSPVLNMSFETTRFGDTDYVSRDQLEAAMAQTRRDASRDGAKRGMSMTLDRLQQSPQTRSRVGLR
jgi:tape measure domain-containing protein